VITKPSKKIILGKPITSKQQKMSLQELKALSRQIRPLTSSTNNKSNDNIILISKNLRENLFKAKSKMMDSLKKSSTPKDVEIYEYLNKENICPPAYLSSSSSSSTTSSDNEDDDDCNSVDSSIQLKLVTNESGSVSLVPTTGSDSSQSSNSTVSSYDDEDFMPLYTPDYSCTMNMDFFGGLEQPEWLQAKSENNTDMVTEDQINSWLQRGGFGDHMSPITMATDQELAGKKNRKSVF
jgi:hypothetical protein